MFDAVRSGHRGAVLGPLPPVHRWLVCALALVTCVGLGAWTAWRLAAPELLPAGVVVGGTLGIAAAFLLLRDDSPPPRERARRPR
jgi:hypothetical protein